MPGFFSENFLDRVRAANDIVDVIGSRVPLKRAGASFVALCPFHREKSPSFHVNPQRQIFHCFGCNKGGNVFSFIRDFENVDFPEAVRRLAERAKIPLETEQGGAAPEARHLKEQLLQIHEQVTQYWQDILAREPAGQVARDYLSKRGVSAEAIKLFRLGAAPEAWDDTVNWANKKRLDLQLVVNAGLILKKEESSRYYDRFRGRLMFPICDDQGRVIGFSGRVLSGDEKTAKYVNSPETPIFTKSKVFFGLDKSKRALLAKESAVVCEGQLDLIACFMAGIENVVAPQGTAFTAEHARIIKRFVEEVVLCFDSDAAGQNAAVRSLDHLLASGLAVRVAVVPQPHDPDSFIKAFGGLAFKQLIDAASDFFEYYLVRLCRENDPNTDKGRLVILQSMAEAVHKTGNSVVIDTYAQKTALRLAVAPDAVRAEFKKHKVVHRPPAPENPVEPRTPEPAAPLPPPSATEFWLLKLLLGNDDLVPWAAAHLDVNWLQDPRVKEIVSQRLAAHAEQTWSGLGGFVERLTAPGLQSLATQAAAEERPVPNPAQQLADVAQKLRNQEIDRRMNTLRYRASLPETPETQSVEFLKQIEELRSLKRQPLPL